MRNGIGKSVSALGLMVALGAIAASSSAAHADCLSACLGTCANNVSEPFCRQVQHTCYYDQCVAGHDHSGPKYGAIAYSSDTGAYGWSNKRGTQAEAENVALEQCGKRASDCEIEVWFDRRCGAVAAGDKWVGHGWGATQQQAQSQALQDCRQEGDNACEVKVTACSNGDAD
jgi:hypothetical protein